MHDYDVALKLLLQTSAHATLRNLIEADIVRWLHFELRRVQNWVRIYWRFQRGPRSG